MLSGSGFARGRYRTTSNARVSAGTERRLRIVGKAGVSPLEPTDLLVASGGARRAVAGTDRPDSPGFAKRRARANLRRRAERRPRIHVPRGLTAKYGGPLVFANCAHLSVSVEPARVGPAAVAGDSLRPARLVPPAHRRSRTGLQVSRQRAQSRRPDRRSRRYVSPMSLFDWVKE